MLNETNTTNPTTMETLEQYIDRAAYQVAKAIIRMKANGNVDVNRVVSLISYWCEDAEAPGQMDYLISMALRRNHPQCYKLAWPPCYMDQNGNYTYDSTKWA